MRRPERFVFDLRTSQLWRYIAATTAVTLVIAPTAASAAQAKPGSPVKDSSDSVTVKPPTVVDASPEDPADGPDEADDADVDNSDAPDDGTEAEADDADVTPTASNPAPATTPDPAAQPEGTTTPAPDATATTTNPAAPGTPQSGGAPTPEPETAPPAASLPAPDATTPSVPTPETIAPAGPVTPATPDPAAAEPRPADGDASVDASLPGLPTTAERSVVLRDAAPSVTTTDGTSPSVHRAATSSSEPVATSDASASPFQAMSDDAELPTGAARSKASSSGRLGSNGWRRYTVRPGDSLWTIAKAVADGSGVGTVVQRIWDRNRATIRTGNPDVLPSGITILIPRS